MGNSLGYVLDICDLSTVHSLQNLFCKFCRDVFFEHCHGLFAYGGSNFSVLNTLFHILYMDVFCHFYTCDCPNLCLDLELVSKELNHFGVIADLFRQIGDHSTRFVLFCSF